MCSARDNAALPTLGFPIRASAGQWLFSASPRLIAAVHALLRLLVPRHPPCALNILTVILGEALRLHPVIPVSLATVQFSRSGKRNNSHARELESYLASAGGEPVSQNSTACSRIVAGVNPPTCGLPGPVDMLGRSLKAIAAHKGLPRKEVIQPQLPLRLPCYDFTPVASPTFDGSLPKGLGHRLRVLLTPMV
jgi:hypothetical protein